MSYTNGGMSQGCWMQPEEDITILLPEYECTQLGSGYCKDTEPFYHSFMYSLVSPLSSIYPLPTMHSLLVTLYVTEYLIG